MKIHRMNDQDFLLFVTTLTLKALTSETPYDFAEISKALKRVASNCDAYVRGDIMVSED
jgi:hypothetical protein